MSNRIADWQKNIGNEVMRLMDENEGLSFDAALKAAELQHELRLMAEIRQQNAEQPGPALLAVSPATPKIITHKTRTNSLDGPIMKAIEKADSTATATVFTHLRELALAEERPFTGQIEGKALCYTDDNNLPATLTKEMLGKRIKNLLRT